MGQLLNWLKCNWLGVVVPIVSALAAMFAAYFAFDQNQLSKRLAHLHIEPQIKCMFDLPKDANPVFLVANKGDIEVMSLSVAHSLYIFDKGSCRIIRTAKGGYFFRDDLIFREEFGPTDYAYTELIRVDPVREVIAVYLFKLRYYSGEDMQRHTNEELFFVDDGKVYNHSGFRRKTYYRKIMAEIERVRMPEVKFDPGKLKEVLEAFDNTKDLPKE